MESFIIQANQTASDILKSVNNALNKHADQTDAEKVIYFKDSMRDKLAGNLKLVFDRIANLATADIKAHQDELILVLSEVLDSARPNKRDHPAMFKAWEKGNAAIAKAKGKEQA